jgi:hypothetical protein
MISGGLRTLKQRINYETQALKALKERFMISGGLRTLKQRINYETHEK